MPSPARAAVDLLQWPIVGAVLRWRHVRSAAQVTLLLVAAAIVVHGLAGPQIASTNLATLLTWIYYRGLLIVVLLVAANLFCAACPMILVRDLARRLHLPARAWPRWLGRKAVAIALFVAVLFLYELFDLWARPDATAGLVIGYFAAAVLIDTTFRGAAFCKHVCPVGQFNFVASTLSPLEVRARATSVCRTCTTVDCIKGRRAPAAPAIVLQRGCELALFQPTKIGNLDCTFCLDCVHACPHDNVAIGFRVPGEELADDRRRSSIGRLSRRPDLALLVLVFTFGAVLNAFAMTGPVYAVQERIADTLGTSRETPVLGIVFVMALGLIPAALCAGAAWLTRRFTHASGLRVADVAVRYSYALAPLGAGIWLAHYGFHFLTGLGTLLPVTQTALLDATGRAWLGEPDWRWLGIRAGAVFPLQIGATVLGAFGSLALVHRISWRDYRDRATYAALPWIALAVGLAALALWIFAQPMEMRGTGLGG
jgi:polyferredoxin